MAWIWIVCIVWAVGVLFFAFISWFFGGMWGESSSVSWSKTLGWPIYLLGRLFGSLVRYYKNQQWRKRVR